MDFYRINLAAFVVLNAGLFLQQRYWPRPTKRVGDDQSLRDSNSPSGTRALQYQLRVLSVYALAVAGDWFQGPHTYAIYKYEKNIPENCVAFLYAAGFVSGGASAYYVGQIADRYGRRRMCLAYCACYAVTCLSMLSNNLAMLCLGRVLGGHATTILYSVFETWMISDYHALELDDTVLPLSVVFERMTVVSGVVAICSGIIGDGLVRLFGSRIWPFHASLVCCAGAAILMLLLWTENYGAGGAKAGPARPSHRSALRDTRVLVLGFTMLSFEGAMYLFVFFWSAALKSARTISGKQEDLPFGLVFSSFMCAMMAGSTALSIRKKTGSVEGAKFTLLLIFALTIASLTIATLFDQECILFYAFCVIEACVGAYFPSMALIKSEAIGDGIRGSLYSLLRLPLNLFVVIVHAFDREGDEHRKGVFLLCSFLLILAIWSISMTSFERASTRTSI